ncbi:universal stress protein [Comamonas antarctica]|uniref:Universal stress protein n=1 Tax=Comamonas antarctica TaxID=2743470 RepID=A0A6N1X368_9BURK|nr:universal stress protein [Comamonas antarctica]QKV53338.1 universal stress protein [Comamonas antarctica]
MGLQLQNILAAVDGSPASAAVVSRAAMLAAKHGVALRLMDISPWCGTGAAAGPDHLPALARQAAESHGVCVEIIEDRASSVAHIAREAGRHSLIALHHERRVRLRSLWRGSLADQLLRICHSPVLILKSVPAAQESYDRVLVAVDLTPAANDLVAAAGMLDDSSAVQILHAIPPLHANPLRNAEVPEHILRAYLVRRKLEAHAQLLEVAAAALECQKRVETVLRDGEPARHAALQQSSAKAQLVVVGKRRACALLDMLCCGVAKRVIAWCEADIMVVPLDCPGPQSQPASAAHATGSLPAHRLQPTTADKSQP